MGLPGLDAAVQILQNHGFSRLDGRIIGGGEGGGVAVLLIGPASLGLDGDIVADSFSPGDAACPPGFDHGVELGVGEAAVGRLDLGAQGGVIRGELHAVSGHVAQADDQVFLIGADTVGG